MVIRGKRDEIQTQTNKDHIYLCMYILQFDEPNIYIYILSLYAQIETNKAVKKKNRIYIHGLITPKTKKKKI